MNLEKIVAISSLPGLYKIIASRDNGLIVEDFDSGKRKFVSVRQYMFTPLESVSIFTESDSVALKPIFQTMLDKLEEVSLDEVINSPQDLSNYFGTILPDYDRDRVYIGDMKKVVKWFKFLLDRNLISKGSEEEE